MKKILLIIGLILIGIFLFGCIEETQKGFEEGTWGGLTRITIANDNMSPTLNKGEVYFVSLPTAETNFGQEIELDLNVVNVPTINFVEPIYSGIVLESLKFVNGEIIVPDKRGVIIVYRDYPNNTLMFNRAIVKVKGLDGEVVITKGDNDKTNPTFDQDCGEIANGKTEKLCLTHYAIPTNELKIINLK